MPSEPGGSRHFLEKNASTLLLIFSCLMLCMGFVIKISQFHSPGEDFRDGLLALQLSRGWLESRPFLYDNYFGFHTRIHNYFFLPLTGFITVYTGIYGFFILYLGLIFGLLTKIILWAKKKSGSAVVFCLAIVFLFIFGPVNLYTFLDFYGWHAEQYFFPLLGLATFYIAQDKRISAALFLTLSLLIKESAPVIICGILLFASSINIVLKNPERSFFKTICHRRNVQIILACFSIFIFGMLWLSFQNGSEKSRLGEAILHFTTTNSSNGFIKYFSKTVLFSSFIFLAGLIPFVPFIRSFPKKNLLFLILTAYFFILTFVFFVEGLYYYPDFRLGLPYPARTGGLWTFLTCCFIFLMIKAIDNKLISNNKSWNYIIYGFIFQLLLYPLLFSFNEFTAPDISKTKIGLPRLSMAEIAENTNLTPTEKQLYSLAEKLPKGSEVVVPDQYQALFQRVYAYEWFHKDLVLGKPKLYIYEKEKLQKSRDYTFPITGYKVLPNDQLLILADSTWQIN